MFLGHFPFEPHSRQPGSSSTAFNMIFGGFIYLRIHCGCLGRGQGTTPRDVPSTSYEAVWFTKSMRIVTRLPAWNLGGVARMQELSLVGVCKCANQHILRKWQYQTLETQI